MKKIILTLFLVNIVVTKAMEKKETTQPTIEDKFSQSSDTLGQLFESFHTDPSLSLFGSSGLSSLLSGPSLLQTVASVAAPLAEKAQAMIKESEEALKQDKQFKKELLKLANEYMTIQWLQLQQKVEKESHEVLPQYLQEQYREEVILPAMKDKSKALNVNGFRAYIMKNVSKEQEAKHDQAD